MAGEWGLAPMWLEAEAGRYQDLMQVRAISGRRSVRLVMEGELDIAGAPLLTDALRDIDPGARRVIPRAVILDLRAVTFLDSAGLHALIEARDACRERGWEMLVVRGPAQVVKVFSLTGMEQELRVVDHPSQIPAVEGSVPSQPRVHPLARWSSFRSGADVAAGAEGQAPGEPVSPRPPPAPASPGSRPGTA